jgi:hypothetical protein
VSDEVDLQLTNCGRSIAPRQSINWVSIMVLRRDNRMIYEVLFPSTADAATGV